MRVVLTLAGTVCLVLGALLSLGGIWLAALGGSFFYLIAGLLMAATGFYAATSRPLALWLAYLLLGFAALWSLWEVGFDFWQSVPRILTFLVVAIVATAVAPWLTAKGAKAPLGCKASAGIAAGLGLVLVAFLAGMFFPHAQVTASGPAKIIDAKAGDDQGNEWHNWARGTDGARFAQFTQINKSNVAKLKVAWTFRTGDLAVNGAEYQVTPIEMNDTLYLCTPLNKVIAVDPVTGKEKWRFDPHVTINEQNAGWKRCRGVTYTDEPGATAANPAPADQSQDSAAITPALPCRRRIISTTIDFTDFCPRRRHGRVVREFRRSWLCQSAR